MAVETVVCFQARANTTISASGLNTTDVLDCLSLPYGPNCYNGHPLIASLLHDVSNSSHDPFLSELVPQLPQRFAHTYKKPKLPEENFCRMNLNALLDLIFSLLINQRQFFVRSGVSLRGFREYFLVKASSQPESALVFNNNVWKCGVIGGDAKTVDDGYHKAAAQASHQHLCGLCNGRR